MQRILIYILFILLSVSIFAQSEIDTIISGKVSYQSVENIYVSFVDTKGIEKGDTLFLKKNRAYIPVIRTNYISSKSISGISIGNSELKIGDEVFAFVKIESEEKKYQSEISEPPDLTSSNAVNITVKKYNKSDLNEPSVKGKLSVQSYSNFSNQASKYDYQRWRYVFKLNAQNIGGSDLSYSQYINFAYRSSEWKSVSSNLGQAIRVYDLAFNYKFSQSASLWFGRHINRKVSNIGTIDGLQFDLSLPVFTIGVVTGSRPNFSDMGVNTKLFEYGIYINRFDTLGQRGMENTLAYFEQTNDFKTDRRFLYFQHMNYAITNTTIFFSSEIDLFKKEYGESKSKLSLTSLFISANIRPSKIVSLYFSYDARKNVIYYETFKSFADSVYENETRQGFRTRITIKPLRNLYLGMNYGYRFRKGDPKPSNNYGGYVTYSLVPYIESGITLSASNLTGIYAKGTMWGIRLYKDFDWGIGFAVGFRNIKYLFTQNIADVVQQSVTFDINTRLLDPIFATVSYEGVFQDNRSSGRILLNLSYRF